MIRRGRSVFTPERDNRVKIMNERINMVEKHVGEMCSVFAGFNRKLGRYRDKHDDVAKTLKIYSEEEGFSKTSASGLDSISKAITFLADFKDIEVHRIEVKVINELAQYETFCRTTRESLKTAVAVRDKEVNRQKQLLEIKSKFSANSSAADSELLKAKLDVNRANKTIDDIIENFEKKKLKDVKAILLDFIAIQLKQYTKSIEVLSATYQDISDIDERKDFQDFRKSLKIKSTETTGFLQKFRSQSMDSLSIPRGIPSAKQKRDKLYKSTRNLSSDFNEEEDQYIKEDSEDDDEDLSVTDENENSEEASQSDDDIKIPSPKPRVLTFKTFCEGVEIPKTAERTNQVTYSSSLKRQIQIKSINGILKGTNNNNSRRLL